MGDFQNSINVPTDEDEMNEGDKLLPNNNKTKRTRWKGCCGLITLEPLMFLFSFYISMNAPTTQQYVFSRIALDHNTTIEALNNLSTCTDNHSDPDYILHQAVQHDTSTWWALLMASVLPPAFIATLLLGSYSDKGGRKLGICLPLLGSLVKVMLLIVITVLELPIAVLFLALMVDGISGSFGSFLMSSFSYVSDITTFKNRALRIVVVESSLGVGVIAGQLAFGQIASVGFFYSYILQAVLLILAFLYAFFILPESRVVTEKPKVFTTDHMKRLVEVYAKNDGHGRRWKLLVCVGILVFASMMETGRGDATLLFVQNSPLCWNPLLLGYYGALSFILSTVGSIVITKIMQNKVQDMVLVFIGTVSCFAQNVFQAFSTVTWMMFFSCVIGMLSRLTTQLLRSYSSKVVSSDEQGAMYAAFAIIQVTGILCGSIFFTTVYNLTLEWMLGFVFLVAALFCFLSMLLSLVGLLLQKIYGGTYYESLTVDVDANSDVPDA